MDSGLLIHAGSKFTLELVERSESGSVVVKYPTAAIPMPSVLARLEHEYSVGSLLQIANVREVIGRTTWKQRPAIELRYVAGETFKSYFQTPEHRHLETVLRLALSAATTLAELHGAGVLHRDIAASNLLVAEDGNRAVFIDLGFATRGGRHDASYVASMEGQLPYLSPEQTGRLDLPIDVRSDLYSFGIVLYEMLTGTLPFQAEDPAGWVHAHLARVPDSPRLRVPELPQVVADIVMRLLAKVPDDRYQTARGLCADLALCLDALRSSGEVPPFQLGRADHSGRLRLPPHLYGRERERELLRAALTRAVGGEPGVLFVGGFSGTGKTALVNELRFPAVATGGRFVGGKFDQTLRAIPYAGFAEAFTQVCQQMLGGTEAELAAFRGRVLETLGANASLLLEFVPGLAAIIGSQPVPQSLPTLESANRFAMTLLGFFHCMVDAEHPLVLFLDDLQWADAASLELLRMIMSRSVRRHFLIVCAYREAELGAAPALPGLMEHLRNGGVHIEKLSLDGLSLSQSETMLADMLDVAPEKAAPLAAMIHAKTGGNPFFMRQVLETLAGEDALHFDAEAAAWQWDDMRVNALGISDNVIELMLRKIASLPTGARTGLQVAACIGNTFLFDLADNGLQVEPGEARTMLAPAVEEGLIAVLNGHARFTHDRIQQAVYQTLSAEEAQRIHLALGRHLLAQGQGRDQVLAAVQQLNIGAPLIEAEDECLRLATLNLEAGRMVKSAMAYGGAGEFFAQGEQMLARCSHAPAPLSFELRLQRAEIEFLAGHVAAAIGSLRALLADAPDAQGRARIYELLIRIHTVEFNLTEALATGVEALKELGVVIPVLDSETALLSEVDAIDSLLAQRGVDRIDQWPEMTDSNALAVMGLLTNLVPAAYIANAGIFPGLAIEFMRRAVTGGLSAYTSFAISTYGLLLTFKLQRFEQAGALSRFGVRLAERPDAQVLRARVHFFSAVLILHWTEPLATTLPQLEAAWKAGIENGDLQFASYCINHILGNGLFAGQSLAELEQNFIRFDDINKVIRQEDGQQLYSMLRHTVAALRKPGEEPADIAAEYGGQQIVDAWRKYGNATLLSMYHVLQTLLCLLLERPAAALAAADQAALYLGGVGGMTWVPQHHFLRALATASACRDRQVAREQAMPQIAEHCRLLADWATHSPANYRAKQLLIEAEIADLADHQHGPLLDAFDAAIAAAAQAGCTLDEAMANERAAGCWARRGKQHLAGMYLQRALLGYEYWGADAKVAQLQRDQMPLLGAVRLHETDDSSSSSGLHAVDIQSVLKAAQTVAGELVMDRMLSRLIKIVVETAGAQCGYLLLEQDGEWRVVAEQRPDRETGEVLQWRLLEDFPDIAASVVQYVARTMETVSLDDALKSSLFSADASIVRRGCKSLLCLPIINRGSLGGILYLENNLATHAFTRTHKRVLQLLTAQAISSLEISRYYARVQTLNQSLTAEIEERKRTEQKLDFIAHHDALTQLPNRRLFYDRAQHAITRAQRSGEHVAVMFLDLDQFKAINDSLSHQVGDYLLQEVAKRLGTLVRDGDTLGRLGGDEFVLLMEGSFEPRSLPLVANKLLSAFHTPFHINDYDLYPTCSLGISLYPDDAADADQLLRNADAAMYRAKLQGRNTFQFFSSDLADAAAERLALEYDLRRAIEREEFELYFQPQFALDSGKVTGGEALIRWHHPERGLLMPGSFISLAEETGSIIAIGEWVLRQACRQLAAWRRDGIFLPSVAVNVSGAQFGWQGGFAGVVQSIMAESGITPECLEIELTESVVMQDVEQAMHALAELNALGIRLAIDDFGTGYSSLSYLKRLPVHRLKIDRSFVCNLPDAQDDAMIVRAIMDLGRNLGKQVIAEGIETEAQRAFLRQAGCTEGQGYLFGRPMSAPEFTGLLRGQQ
ncbi:MAG: EAL domain-containing protein [Gammaproteobacteria bacterium]|nr:EAL domain-containing protein [Gammaproteobacteria bacterium]MBU1969817.1 EAL domain-containing protein [Gammaproteobacteria bacterium]